jgi:hypothetical protein
MSGPGEALLSGLSGGAQHAGYGGPGGVVLPGAENDGLNLFVGVDQAAAGLAFAEGAALCIARRAQGDPAVGDVRGELTAWSVGRS